MLLAQRKKRQQLAGKIGHSDAEYEFGGAVRNAGQGIFGPGVAPAGQRVNPSAYQQAPQHAPQRGQPRPQQVYPLWVEPNEPPPANAPRHAPPPNDLYAMKQNYAPHAYVPNTNMGQAYAANINAPILTSGNAYAPNVHAGNGYTPIPLNFPSALPLLPPSAPVLPPPAPSGFVCHPPLHFADPAVDAVGGAEGAVPRTPPSYPSALPLRLSPAPLPPLPPLPLLPPLPHLSPSAPFAAVVGAEAHSRPVASSAGRVSVVPQEEGDPMDAKRAARQRAIALQQENARLCEERRRRREEERQREAAEQRQMEAQAQRERVSIASREKADMARERREVEAKMYGKRPVSANRKPLAEDTSNTTAPLPLAQTAPQPPAEGTLPYASPDAEGGLLPPLFSPSKPAWAMSPPEAQEGRLNLPPPQQQQPLQLQPLQPLQLQPLEPLQLQPLQPLQLQPLQPLRPLQQQPQPQRQPPQHDIAGEAEEHLRDMITEHQHIQRMLEAEVRRSTGVKCAQMPLFPPIALLSPRRAERTHTPLPLVGGSSTGISVLGVNPPPSRAARTLPPAELEDLSAEPSHFVGGRRLGRPEGIVESAK